MTGRDEAALFAVQVLTDKEGPPTAIEMGWQARWIYAVSQEEGFFPFLRPIIPSHQWLRGSQKSTPPSVESAISRWESRFDETARASPKAVSTSSACLRRIFFLPSPIRRS